jgi:hypothetical protein
MLDEFWIYNWIYWTILQLMTARITITHRQVTSVMLLANGFQRPMFLCFWAPNDTKQTL